MAVVGMGEVGSHSNGAVVSPGVGTPNTGVSRGLEVPAPIGIARDWLFLNICRCWVDVGLVLGRAR